MLDFVFGAFQKVLANRCMILREVTCKIVPDSKHEKELSSCPLCLRKMF